MHTGQRRIRISIESKAVAKGASGGKTETWTALANTPVWAGKRSLSGNERGATSAGGEVAEARDEFDIRYRDDVTAGMRVVYKGAYYNIRHVKNWMERNESLILTCESGVNRG